MLCTLTTIHQVTAGTPFMMRLKNALCVWACTRLQSDPRYHFTRIYISGPPSSALALGFVMIAKQEASAGPDVPGEGEIKIMEFISTHANSDSVPALQPQERLVAYQNVRPLARRWLLHQEAEPYSQGFAEPERNPEKFRKDTHLIVGTDADLILLGSLPSTCSMPILFSHTSNPGLCTMLQNVFILTAKIGKQIKNIFSIWELTRVMEQLSPIPVRRVQGRRAFLCRFRSFGHNQLPSWAS